MSKEYKITYNFFNEGLSKTDPELLSFIKDELNRQQNHLELIEQLRELLKYQYLKILIPHR